MTEPLHAISAVSAAHRLLRRIHDLGIEWLPPAERTWSMMQEEIDLELGPGASMASDFVDHVIGEIVLTYLSVIREAARKEDVDAADLLDFMYRDRMKQLGAPEGDSQ